MLKTSRDWVKMIPKDFDLKILNPSGWDGENREYSFNDELITKEEFDKRMGNSVLEIDSDRMGGNLHGIKDAINKIKSEGKNPSKKVSVTFVPTMPRRRK